MSINITAIVKSKTDSIESVKEHLIAMAENSKNEKNCLQYDLHQDANDPAVFIFHEIWESEAALATHNTQPYIREFVAKSESLLATPLTIFKTNKIR